MAKDKGLLKFLWIALFTLILDLASKFAVVLNMQVGESIPVSAFFNVTFVYNNAAAMGLFGFLNNWQFAGLAVLVCIAMVWWLATIPKNHKIEGIGIAMIVGGALGNAFDRVYHGKVVDFLDFFWPYSDPVYRWYTFNIADVGIVVGVGFLLFHSFFLESKLKRQRES